MYRKPQNLQIQGQTSEVNPAISAGPTLGPDAALGPKRTFEAVDLTRLSNTLSRLGRERQNVLEEAELRTGVRVQDMIEQNKSVDAILKELTGTTPKKLLVDIEKQIRNGTLEETDSPAFQMGYQRRRAEYRSRHIFNEIINNEELIDSYVNEIANGGLAENRTTTEEVLARVREAVAEGTSDLGPWSQEVVAEMSMEYTERLRQDLTARVKAKVKANDQRLLENDIGELLDTFSYAAVDSDGTLVMDGAVGEVFQQSVADLFAAERGRSGDPAKKVGNAILNQAAEFANVHGLKAAADLLEEVYSARDATGSLMFDGTPTGEQMLKEAERLRRKIVVEAEDKGETLNDRKNEAALILIETEEIRKPLSDAIRTNDPLQVLEVASGLILDVEEGQKEWVKGISAAQRPFVIDQLEAKAQQRASMAKSAGGADFTSIVSEARAVLSAGEKAEDPGVLAKAMASIDASDAPETAKIQAKETVGNEYRQGTQRLIRELRLGDRIAEMLSHNQGFLRLPEAPGKKQDILIQTEEIISQKLPGLMKDINVLDPDLNREKVAGTILDKLAVEFPDRREITRQLEVGELLGREATTTEIQETKETLESVVGDRDDTPSESLVGGFVREDVQKAVEDRDDPNYQNLLEMDESVRRVAKTFEGPIEVGIMDVLQSTWGYSVYDTRAVARLHLVPQMLEDLDAVTEGDFLNRRRKAKTVGESIITTGALTASTYVDAMERGSMPASDELKAAVFKDLDIFRGKSRERVAGQAVRQPAAYEELDRDRVDTLLDRGFDVGEVDIFTVKFAGFEDAANSVTTLSDSESLAFPKIEGKLTARSENHYKQARMILEARGLVPSEDAVLTFVYVQSRLHTR